MPTDRRVFTSGTVNPVKHPWLDRLEALEANLLLLFSTMDMMYLSKRPSK